MALVKDIPCCREDLSVLAGARHEAPRPARHAFRAGASGDVRKQEMSETPLLAIRRLLAGKNFVGPKVGSGSTLRSVSGQTWGNPPSPE